MEEQDIENEYYCYFYCYVTSAPPNQQWTMQTILLGNVAVYTPAKPTEIKKPHPLEALDTTKAVILAHSTVLVDTGQLLALCQSFHQSQEGTYSCRQPAIYSPYLPASTSIFVVRKIRGYPVVNVTECHSLLGGAVNGECNERCVREGRLGVVVAVSLCLHGVQSCRQVYGARGGLSSWRPHSGRFTRRFHLARRVSESR